MHPIGSQDAGSAYELMRSNLRPPKDDTHYRLKGALGKRSLAGKELEQWQIKVSSGAVSGICPMTRSTRYG